MLLHEHASLFSRFCAEVERFFLPCRSGYSFVSHLSERASIYPGTGQPPRRSIARHGPYKRFTASRRPDGEFHPIAALSQPALRVHPAYVLWKVATARTPPVLPAERSVTQCRASLRRRARSNRGVDASSVAAPRNVGAPRRIGSRSGG